MVAAAAGVADKDVVSAATAFGVEGTGVFVDRFGVFGYDVPGVD